MGLVWFFVLLWKVPHMDACVYVCKFVYFIQFCLCFSKLMVGFLGLIWQEFEFSLLNIDGLCESSIFWLWRVLWDFDALVGNRYFLWQKRCQYRLIPIRSWQGRCIRHDQMCIRTTITSLRWLWQLQSLRPFAGLSVLRYYEIQGSFVYVKLLLDIS